MHTRRSGSTAADTGSGLNAKTLLSVLPNPMYPSCNIFFSLQKDEYIKLELNNLAGTKITTLINGRFKVGNHNKKWNAVGHAAGVYMVRLTTSAHSQTSKVILTR
jgi:hypothetical protein